MGYTIKIKNAQTQIVGMLLAVPAMVFILGLVLPELPSSPMLRDSFWAHKIEAEASYDIVFTGDSRVYRGIDPDVIDSALGCSSFNYGFSSAGLDSFLLNKAVQLLNPNGKRILVIGISVNSFMQGSLENRHLRSLQKWNHKDVWIRKHLYPHLTYFDPYTISDFYKLSKGERYIEEYNILNGFAASVKIPLDSGSAIPAYRDQFRHESYSKEAENRFVTYVQELQRKNIRVLIVRMPVSQEMKALEDAYAGPGFERLRQELEQAGAIWPDMNHDGTVKESGTEYLPGKMPFISYDGSHLTAESARAFSRQLALQLKALDRFSPYRHP